MNDRRDIIKEMKREYFDWLIELIDGYEYVTLIDYLHNIPFRWVIKQDENRATDGQALRDRFEYDNHYTDLSYPPEECSVFELLVGLASRINDILIGIEQEDQTSKWFWRLLNNLNLEYYTDTEFHFNGGYNDVNDILDVFMYREYDYNGAGGLFPLKNAQEDQRDVELWYQMNAYLGENY